MAESRFVFPRRGFHIVANKVGEADFFLDRLKESRGYYVEYSYYLSAFVSAARSITFALQAVMSEHPGFESWYVCQQDGLRGSRLAKYFVELRNHMQKVGVVPLHHTGSMRSGQVEHYSFFVNIEGLKKAPEGEVVLLAQDYLVEVLTIVEKCYRDFWAYVDPRAVFTEKGLAILGWSIEDLEEAVGLPRGWTDVPYEADDKNYQRLRMLQRQHGGDELMEKFFEKYGVPMSVAV